jgi:hypothetical protein
MTGLHRLDALAAYHAARKPDEAGQTPNARRAMNAAGCNCGIERRVVRLVIDFAFRPCGRRSVRSDRVTASRLMWNASPAGAGCSAARLSTRSLQHGTNVPHDGMPRSSGTGQLSNVADIIAHATCDDRKPPGTCTIP